MGLTAGDLAQDQDQGNKAKATLDAVKWVVLLTEKHEDRAIEEIPLATIKMLIDKNLLEKEEKKDKQIAYQRIAKELARRVASGNLSATDKTFLAICKKFDSIYEAFSSTVKHARLFKLIYTALRAAQTNVFIFKTNFLAGKEHLSASDFMAEVYKLTAANQADQNEAIPRSQKAYTLFFKYKDAIFNVDGHFNEAVLRELQKEIYLYGYDNSNIFLRETRYKKSSGASIFQEKQTLSPESDRSDRSEKIEEVFRGCAQSG